MKHNAMIAAAVAACVIAVASCGGSNSSESSGSGSQTSSGSGSQTSNGSGAYSKSGGASSTPAAGSAVMVKLSSTGLGHILTDGKGRTLYLFEKDKGTKSTCSGACAAGWPPLVSKGTPALGSGLTMSDLGMTTRSGGARQVTYGGHPLYYFAGDQGPGQTAGEGLNAFGAEWYALSAAGKKVEKAGS